MTWVIGVNDNIWASWPVGAEVVAGYTLTFWSVASQEQLACAFEHSILEDDQNSLINFLNIT